MRHGLASPPVPVSMTKDFEGETMLCDRCDRGLIELRLLLPLLVRRARGDAGRLRGSGEVDRSEYDIVIAVAVGCVYSLVVLSISTLRVLTSVVVVLVVGRQHVQRCLQRR